MNKERRKELSKAISILNDAQEKLCEARDIVEACKNEEEECYDNLPESVQWSERGETMSENVDSLDEIYNELESTTDTIEEQIDAIQEVIDRRARHC